MYKAIERFGFCVDGLREHIYVSKSVERRFQTLKPIMKENRGLQTFLAKLCEYDIAWMSQIVRHNRYPYLNEYLKIADYLLKEGYTEWDLSRDVNFWYAQVLIDTDEIQQRVMRCFQGVKQFYSACFLLERDIGYDITTVRDTIRYGKKRVCILYGRIMHYLMRRENAAKYPDALVFEA